MDKKMRKPVKLETIFEQCVFCTLIPVSVFLTLVSIAEPWVYRDANGMLTILFAILSAIFLAGILSCIRKLSSKAVQLGVWIGISLTFCIQLYIVFHMQLVPNVDLSHIYEQCMEMLETGSPRLTNIKYFGFNTNNIPITIILYWVFRFSRALGFTNARLAGGICNVLLLFVIYALSFLIMKKMTTLRTAAAVIAMLLANPAFYAYAAYYYTDTFSLAFTIGSVYLILCGVKSSVKWKQLLCLFSSACLLGIAAQIRITSIFIIIAILICALIKNHWRKLLPYSIPFLGGLLVFMLLWNRLYAYHVDFDVSESSITVEHFLMMGSARKGTYNADDMKFTRSFDTHEEKVKNNLRVYRQRLRKNGLLGNLKLVIIKEAIVWGIGSRGYSQYTQNVTEQTACYDWITGKKSTCFRAYMQSYNIILFFVITLGLMEARKEKSMGILILSVYWGGALTFYMFWEAHARHSLSFLPFLTMLAAPWFSLLTKKGKKREEI